MLTAEIVWDEAALDQMRSRDGKVTEQTKLMEEVQARKEGIRKAGVKDVPGGSL